MGKAWTVRGNFHTIGEVIVTVEAGSWVSALGKGARALKASPQLKGKRVKALSLTLQEAPAHSKPQAAAAQGQLPDPAPAAAGQDENPPDNSSPAQG